MTDQPDVEKPAQPNAGEQRAEPKEFGTFLLEHNKGRTHGELTDRMAELVAAVAESGKKGTLTLKIEVKPTKSDGVVEVIDDVKLAAPTARARTSMFFIDPATSSLVRNDPNQHALY